jgi:glycosyltransferase involved in cell wall biosynthesis
MWFWELSTFPDHLHDAFDVVQEIWVASDFIRAAVASETDLPVLDDFRSRSRHARIRRAAPVRPHPSGSCFFSRSTFSASSTGRIRSERSRRFGRAIRAGRGACLAAEEHQRRAAPSPSSSNCGGRRAGRGDIVVVDQYVSSREKDALTARCDCYVSLHRSEGFGLTMAEAMAWGKPVIATAYSGNLEFMDNDNSYLVSIHTSGDEERRRGPIQPASSGPARSGRSGHG